jgi:hypothetical protein
MHKRLVSVIVRAPRLTRLVQTQVIRMIATRFESYDMPGYCLEGGLYD